MNFFTTRKCYVLGFIACLALLLTAFYMQYFMSLLPCPLCELQRAIMMILAALFIVAAFHNPKRVGNGIYGFLIFIISIMGAFVAGRQVYMQHLPPNTVESCGASLQYLFEIFSFFTALKTALMGSGDCAKVDWEFLGLSLAGWSFISFLFFAFLGLFQSFRKGR